MTDSFETVDDTLVNVELASPTPNTPREEQQTQHEPDVDTVITVDTTKPLVRTKSKREKAENDYDLAYGNLGLKLKHYDNIFNPFDGRPYLQRHLSLDFLEEVQSRVRKTLEGDAYEVYLLIPSSMQDDDTDDIVRRRLRLHYSIQYEKFRQEAIQAQLWSTFIMIMGFCGIAITTYLGLEYGDIYGTYFKVLMAICEVTSWFVIWTYLDKVQNIQRRNVLDLKRHKLKTAIRVHIKRIRG